MKNTLGKNIKKIRLENKITQEELGNFIGVNKATIQRYENGKITNIPSDKIEKMAKFLNITPSELMGWNEQEKSRTIADLDTRGINRIAAQFEGEKFSDSDLDEIQNFIYYVQAKNKVKNKENKNDD